VHNYITKHAEKKPVKATSNKVDKDEEKKLLQIDKEYKEALAYVKDAISPAYMKIWPNKIQINETLARTFFVYAYPTFLE
jgi:hypothetical protein